MITSNLNFCCPGRVVTSASFNSRCRPRGIGSVIELGDGKPLSDYYADALVAATDCGSRSGPSRAARRKVPKLENFGEDLDVRCVMRQRPGATSVVAAATVPRKKSHHDRST